MDHISLFLLLPEIMTMEVDYLHYYEHVGDSSTLVPFDRLSENSLSMLEYLILFAAEAELEHAAKFLKPPKNLRSFVWGGMYFSRVLADETARNFISRKSF
jgi:hypothetical protein